MIGKASMISVVVGGIVYYLLEWVGWGMWLMGTFKDAMPGMAGLMRPEDTVNPAIWLIPCLIGAWLIVWIAGRSGAISLNNGAMTGAILFGLVALNVEINSYQTMMDYPFMQVSLLATGWEAVAGAVTGAVIGLVHSKMSK
jgi:hypothetical protein